MSSNESWVTEKVTEFHDVLLCRFREQAAIHASLRNLIKPEETKNNKAQLELMTLRVDKQILSDTLFVKECLKNSFINVLNKADGDARYSMFLRENALQQIMKQSSNILSTRTS